MFVEILSKNQFASVDNSNNSQNSVFHLKKTTRILVPLCIPISLIFELNWDILERKILYKFVKNLSKDQFTGNNFQNSQFIICQCLLPLKM